MLKLAFQVSPLLPLKHKSVSSCTEVDVTIPLGPAVYNTLKTTVRGYNLEELANHGKYSCNDVFARTKLQLVIITVRPHPVHIY